VSCVPEPIPGGWRVWRGPVPAPLTQAAMDVRDHIRQYERGTIARVVEYNGTTAAFFVSSHSWTYKRQPDGSMKLITGLCIPGVSLLSQATPVGANATADTPFPDPDPELAVYGADDVPDETNWGLVVVGSFAIFTVTWAFVQGMRRAKLLHARR